MEWYRILLILVGVGGIIVALVNWYINKQDIPNGILTVLMLIVSSAMGPEALSKLKDGLFSSKKKDEDKDKEGE